MHKEREDEREENARRVRVHPHYGHYTLLIHLLRVIRILSPGLCLRLSLFMRFISNPSTRHGMLIRPISHRHFRQRRICRMQMDRVLWSIFSLCQRHCRRLRSGRVNRPGGGGSGRIQLLLLLGGGGWDEGEEVPCGCGGGCWGRHP